MELLEQRGERGHFLASTDDGAAMLRKHAEAGGHGVRPFVPLQALLQQAKAVLHSGTHGTNALTLAAGLPSVVVPSLFDQVWHGERQEALGTGILVRRPKDLAAAVDRLLADDPLTSAAQALAALMADEDGPRKRRRSHRSILDHKPNRRSSPGKWNVTCVP